MSTSNSGPSATGRWRVDQQDTEGFWWPGPDKFEHKHDADLKAIWMDCPTRVVNEEAQHSE